MSPPPGLGPVRVTHRLLGLALVGLDLQLQLVHQVLQPQQVLPVLLRLGAYGREKPVFLGGGRSNYLSLPHHPIFSSRLSCSSLQQARSKRWWGNFISDTTYRSKGTARSSVQDLKSKEGCGPKVRNGRRGSEPNRISSSDNMETSGLFQL